jgi:hypothetical protein
MEERQALVARTVLDLRPSVDKFVSQTLLLAAGWHRHASRDARLEVYSIGGRDPVVDALLAEIGAQPVAIGPGPNDDFSPSSNKIQAAFPDAGGARVLLLDNDVVFLAGLDGLHALPAGAIAAAEAGTARVSDEQWRIIAGDLGLPLLRRRFVPLNHWPELPEDLAAARDAAPEAYLYLNSGVVLFPAGFDARTAWTAHQRRIRDHFHGHPIATPAVAASDQAALAALVAAHGEFCWLPVRFNYRHGGFRLGLEAPGRIAIVHLTGDVPGEGLALTQRLEAYWSKYVRPKIARLSPAVGAGEKARRRDVAERALADTLSLVRDYDLDVRLAAWRRGRA